MCRYICFTNRKTSYILKQREHYLHTRMQLTTTRTTTPSQLISQGPRWYTGLFHGASQPSPRLTLYWPTLISRVVPPPCIMFLIEHVLLLVVLIKWLVSASFSSWVLKEWKQAKDYLFKASVPFEVAPSKCMPKNICMTSAGKKEKKR
jgi:hypothetical protein